MWPVLKPVLKPMFSPPWRRLSDIMIAVPPQAPPPNLLGWLWHDRLLRIVFLIAGFVIGYQLVVTVAQPPWITPATDWLHVALVWPELLVVVVVAIWFTRHHVPDAASLWMLSLVLLSYAIARTIWTTQSQLIYHGRGVPFPSLPDLFLLLQYPFAVLAALLSPGIPLWSLRLKVLLDGVLVMAAATALSWYFILEPIYNVSGLSPLARTIALAYPIGDLGLLFGVIVMLLYPRRLLGASLALPILAVAIMCLIWGDTIVAWLLLSPPHVYKAGKAPDLFWMAFYLLVPLACLVALRSTLIAAPLLSAPEVQPEVKSESALRPRREDLIACARFIFPFVAAVLASLVILLRAAVLTPTTTWHDLIGPLAVSAGLLFLVIARQAIAFLENEQVRRERDTAQTATLVLTEANRRMDAFLAIASHELKTPLTSLQGNIDVLIRRLRAARQSATKPDSETAGPLTTIDMALPILERSRTSVRRIGGLVEDLLDDSHIHEGHLALSLERMDLAVVIEGVVEEQRQLVSRRTITLALPAMRPVLVLADPNRIGQVVTNFLTNALKYSREGLPVEVRLRVVDGRAWVSVRDRGPGLPPDEQPRVWERFYRAPGVAVQSGSGIGLGIGLHISKSIIDAHHGTVGVHSALGRGSTFWFTLPLAEPSGVGVEPRG